MSRVHQALERAQEIERQNQNLGPVGRPAERQSGSKRQRTVTDVTAAVAEPLAVGWAVSIKCPNCGMVQEPSVRGPWMRRFFGLMRIPPHRCRSCRRRFSGFDGRTGELLMNHLEGWTSTFLRPADNRSFDEVIRDIARDEQERAEHDERAEKLRRTEDWSAVGDTHRSHPHNLQ
jgi:transposase-like protein